MHEDDLAAAEETHFASLTAAEADGDERTIEAALRPRTLDEVVGQVRVRDQLGLVLEAARRRGRAPDHVLLSGPPGPRQDDAGDDHRQRDVLAAPADQRSRPSPTPATWPRSSPG